MTKKNSTTITKADLEKAGVTNFQVSKDEFIDLLILAVGEQLEARHREAEETHTKHLQTITRTQQEQYEHVFKYLKTVPMVKKLMKLFPNSEFEAKLEYTYACLSLSQIEDYAYHHKHIICFQHRKDRDNKVKVDFLLTVPYEVTEGFAEHYSQLETQERELLHKKRDAWTKMHNFHETSKKKLKTQLLRKILTSAEGGRNLITKIEANAADLVSSLVIDDEQ